MNLFSLISNRQVVVAKCEDKDETAKENQHCISFLRMKFEVPGVEE